MDHYAAIDYLALADYLANKEWEEKYVEVFPFKELYEKVDDTENYYMRQEWQNIHDAITEKWRDTIMEYDILNTNIGL